MKRAAWREQVAGIDVGRLVFVDESGIWAGMKPRYGRAPGRRRVMDAMARSHRRNLSVIGAVRATGVGETLVIEEAVDTDVFDAYVTECLGPTLQEGDVVVLDNLRVHHASEIERVARERKATVMWLPSYSPDFNPIERLWSKMKALIRAAKATTRDELDTALKQALEAVSRKDIAGWFTHSGYPLEVADK